MAIKVNIKIEIFEKGDRVCTPDGEGTIRESEKIPTDEYEIYNREVVVDLDQPIYKGKQIEIDATYCILI